MNFNDPFWQVRNICIDSRKVVIPQETVFFAIKGLIHDGHEFIKALYQKGVRKFVVDRGYDHALFPEAHFIEVENTVNALQKLAAFHRAQFDIPVIGITGSNGKTIVKEWLYELMEDDYKIVKSPKSYNSQVGVPLSVEEMNGMHELAIFEAGISTTGEMERLKEIIEPTIGIFTNIGTAHDRGFDDRKEKINEKLKLFSSVDSLIFCEDHASLAKEIHLQSIPTFSWGESQQAHLQITHKQELKDGFLVKLNLHHQYVEELFLPVKDKASFENLMHCIACLKYLDYPIETIQRKINLIKNVPMRLSLKQGINQCTLVDDTYNNDFAGLTVALDFAKQNIGNQKFTVVLSDILQVKEGNKELYHQVAELLDKNGVKKFIGIGQGFVNHSSEFEAMESYFYQDIHNLFHELQQKSIQFEDEMILVKGARDFHLEKLTSFLQKRIHGTRMEINLEALSRNLNYYKSLLNEDTKLMVMVKAFAYGTSRHEVARLLQYHLVDYLGVAYADEGVELRSHGIRIPIMVLNPSPDSFELMVKNELEPEIFSFSILDELIHFLQKNKAKLQLPFHIQLNLDTGMHRLGFEKKELEKLISILTNHQDLIKVSAVFTHLAGADESIHRDFTLQQIKDFGELTSVLEGSLGYHITKHALNSAGIVKYRKGQFDMVRLGIGLYGFDPTESVQDQLSPISELKTTISQIKEIPAGETVGYGRNGVSEIPMKIATIAIGYADGFDRRFSKGIGKVLVKGQLAKVVGNVCMDMTMIDITGIDVQEGDEVLIFGKELPIYQLADWLGTIPYEILTSVNERVKRVFITE